MTDEQDSLFDLTQVPVLRAKDPVLRGRRCPWHSRRYHDCLRDEGHEGRHHGWIERLERDGTTVHEVCTNPERSVEADVVVRRRSQVVAVLRGLPEGADRATVRDALIGTIPWLT